MTDPRSLNIALDRGPRSRPPTKVPTSALAPGRVAPRLAMAGSVVALISLAGCEGDRLQSSLHPASPAAAVIAQLWWILLAVLGTYTLAVFILMFVAIFRRSPQTPPRYGGRAFILIGGVVLPSLILVPLLIYSMTTSAALRMPETGLTVRVIGQRWWWQVEYPGQNISTANEIYIPAGEPVRLELTSADVIHSFWVPRLHGKMDMLPGQTTIFWIEADRPGLYRGQCAEFCGVQHARMAFTVEALPPEEFAAWVANQQQVGPPLEPNAAEPDTAQPAAAQPAANRPGFDGSLADELAGSVSGESEPGGLAIAESDQGGAGNAASPSPAAALERGKRAFFRHGCAACHAIRGTRAVGRVGPDLTYIASRATLGAGTVPNTVENLLAWVTNPQPIKPGINMPPTHAPEEEIQAIVNYLRTLQYRRTPPEGGSP